jgi:ribonuclease E
MSKVMLVNVTHVEESRLAILEDGVLAGYEIETINRTNVKGNIYNAVVESIHPTLEAAFLRLAPDLKGFLPLDEVNFKLLPSRQESRKAGRIGQHLHAGQKIMAQVVREPFAEKPPTVSTYFSLPGRFLVLMPGVDSAGISRKIEDSGQRERLKKVVEELRVPDGFGLIVRTAGLGQTKTELQRDMRYLLRLWETVQRGSRQGEFPGLVYREADLVIRTIRDFLTPDVDEVWIDSAETYETALRFVSDVMPNRARTIKLYTGDRPLFNKFNLEEQIERIYKRRVPLPSGGEIVIDGTEALTAIDVNSARAKRTGDSEETNTQTNLEAAAEIARQMRLRDLGGLLVIDFIDMMASRNRMKVERAMREAMKGDRAKYDLTRLSKLGLMECARQRIKSAKMAASYTTCPACEGYGLIKNVETAALAALRKLQTRSSRSHIGRLRVGLPTEVAMWLLNNKREELVRIERRADIRVEVVPTPALLRHESEFEAIAREKTEPVLEESAARAAAPPPEPPAMPQPHQHQHHHQQQPQQHELDEPAMAALPADAVEEPALEPELDAVEAHDLEIQELPDEQDPAEEPDIDEPDASSPVDELEAEPGETDAAEEAQEPGSGGAGGPGDSARNGNGRRRRRRRRRRGRGTAAVPGAVGGEPAVASSTGGSGGGGGSDGGAAPRAPLAGGRGPENELPVVPRGVRSDELMPAATGGRSRSRSGSRSGDGRRRRR